MKQQTTNNAAAAAIIISYFKCIPIALLKACSGNNLGDGPVGFVGLRRKIGEPHTVTRITNILELPQCISLSLIFEEFDVGSMLTHIDGACVCSSNNIPELLNGDVESISFVNSIEAWEAIKLNALRNRISPAEQLSLTKNGFYAQAH